MMFRFKNLNNQTRYSMTQEYMPNAEQTEVIYQMFVTGAEIVSTEA